MSLHDPTQEQDKVLTAIDSWGGKMMENVAARDEQIAEAKEVSLATQKAAEKLETELKGLGELLAEAKERVAELEARDEAQGAVEQESKSIGERFIESDVYSAYKGQDFAGNSMSLKVGAEFGIQTKTTFTGASLGTRPSYMYQTARVAEYVADPDRRLFVRSLIPTFRTSGGAVEFVRESVGTGFTNNADVVPEYAATDSTNKPESAIDFEIVSVPVRTIAHFIPLTRQIVDDAPNLQSYVDNRMRYGLRLKEDQQILSGTGTGNELSGILSDANIQTYSQLSETKVDAIRIALTLGFVAEYAPSGIVMHHNDWRDIELLKGTDDHYIWANVNIEGTMRLWGIPVVTTNAIAAGTALIGDFARGSAIHDRENGTVRLSDSHSDYFTKNLWALLAEERVAQTIYRPNAFIKVTFA